MAQVFVRDEQLCKQYAQFASDLDRWHFKIIYWFMFVLNLMILFIASWTYTKYVICVSLISLLKARVKSYTQNDMQTNIQFPITEVKKLSNYTVMSLRGVQEA